MKGASVVITVYKRYNFVSQAINSVFSQSSPVEEIVIVADSPERLDKLSDIKVVECKSEFHGECVVRGVQESSKGLIFLLEDDDAFVSNKIEKIAEVFGKLNPVYVHNLQFYVDVEGREISRWSKRVFLYEPFQPKALVTWRNARELATLWLKYPALHHNLSSIAVRRNLILENESALSKMRSSLDWAITALSYNGGVHVSHRLTYYRLGSGSTSIRGKGEGELERLIRVYERELESKRTFLKYANLPPEMEDYLKFDVYVHNAYLSFLKGKEFDLDLKTYKEFMGLRNKALVPIELFIQFSLKLSKSLYRLESSVARKVLGVAV